MDSKLNMLECVSSEEGKDSPNPPARVKSPPHNVDFRHASGVDRDGPVDVSESLARCELARADSPCSTSEQTPCNSSVPDSNDDEPNVRRVLSVDSLVDMSPSSSGSSSPSRHHDSGHLPHPHYVCANTFEKLRLLGRGDVGKVYLVRHRDTGELYAMKVLDKQTMMRRKKIRRALTERDILEFVDHPFIVTLHWSFQSLERLYLVMDYCAGGSLFRLMQLQPGRCFHEESVRFFAAEILLALEYLHLNGFIYRDLKLENVLVHDSGHIMLTDFDLSIKAHRSEAQLLNESGEIFATPVTSSHSFVGTAEYLAPEVIEGTCNQSCSVDWWTYGVLIYECLYGHTPFQGKTTEQICAHILDGGLHFPDHHMYPVSADCKSLIKKLLDADPRKRLGGQHDAADIKKHKFFDKISFSLIRNMTPPIVPKLKSATDTSYHRSAGSKDEAIESDTDSELSEDEQLSGPFKDFKQVYQENRRKRTSLVCDPVSLFGRSSHNLRTSCGSLSSSSGSSTPGAGSNLSTSMEHPQPVRAVFSDPNLRRTASCNSLDEAEYWAKVEKQSRDHHHDGHHHHHHHHLNAFKSLFSHHK